MRNAGGKLVKKASGTFRKQTRPCSERLHGEVQLARLPFEVAVDGERRQVMLAVALQVSRGRMEDVRVARLDGGGAPAVVRFVRDHIAAGACIRTGIWPGYERLGVLGYRHVLCHPGADGVPGVELLVQRVTALLQLWLWDGELLDGAVLDRRLDALARQFARKLARSAADEPRPAKAG